MAHDKSKGPFNNNLEIGQAEALNDNNNPSDEGLAENSSSPSKINFYLKKIDIMALALLLSGLLIANTDAGYHLISYFSGKIASSPLGNDYSFSLKYSGKVYFNKTTWLALSGLYKANKKHEARACLTGYKKANNYYVEGIYIPRIYRQDVYSVVSDMCDNRTIISLHTHPLYKCIFSRQDIESFNKFKKTNKNAIIAIMCSEKRLSFYGY